MGQSCRTTLLYRQKLLKCIGFRSIDSTYCPSVTQKYRGVGSRFVLWLEFKLVGDYLATSKYRGAGSKHRVPECELELSLKCKNNVKVKTTFLQVVFFLLHSSVMWLKKNVLKLYRSPKF